MSFKVRKKCIKIRDADKLDEYVSESIDYSARVDALSNVRDSIWVAYEDLSNLAERLVKNEHRRREKYSNKSIKNLEIDLDFEASIFETHKYDPELKQHTEVYRFELEESERNLLRSHVHVLLEKYHAGELFKDE
jgi:hypothetical protein